MKHCLFFLLMVTILHHNLNCQNLVGPVDPFSRYNGYGSGTIVFSALSGACIAYNLVSLNKPGKDRSDAAVGILIGGGQVTYGFFNANSHERNRATLTGINIGVGLAAVLTSVVRLTKKQTPRENTVTLNVTCLPSGPLRTPAPALSLCATIH